MASRSLIDRKLLELAKLGWFAGSSGSHPRWDLYRDTAGAAAGPTVAQMAELWQDQPAEWRPQVWFAPDAEGARAPATAPGAPTLTGATPRLLYLDVTWTDPPGGSSPLDHVEFWYKPDSAGAENSFDPATWIRAANIAAGVQAYADYWGALGNFGDGAYIRRFAVRAVSLEGLVGAAPQSSVAVTLYPTGWLAPDAPTQDVSTGQRWFAPDLPLEGPVPIAAPFNPSTGFDWSEQPQAWNDVRWFQPDTTESWTPIPNLTVATTDQMAGLWQDQSGQQDRPTTWQAWNGDWLPDPSNISGGEPVIPWTAPPTPGLAITSITWAGPGPAGSGPRFTVVFTRQFGETTAESFVVLDQVMDGVPNGSAVAIQYPTAQSLVVYNGVGQPQTYNAQPRQNWRASNGLKAPDVAVDAANGGASGSSNVYVGYKGPLSATFTIPYPIPAATTLEQEQPTTPQWAVDPSNYDGAEGFVPLASAFDPATAAGLWQEQPQAWNSVRWFAPDDALEGLTPLASAFDPAVAAGLWQEQPLAWSGWTWFAPDASLEGLTPPIAIAFDPSTGFDWSEQPASWSSVTWFQPDTTESWTPIPNLTVATTDQMAELWQDQPAEWRPQVWFAPEASVEGLVPIVAAFDPSTGFDWSEQPQSWTGWTWVTPDLAFEGLVPPPVVPFDPATVPWDFTHDMPSRPVLVAEAFEAHFAPPLQSWLYLTWDLTPRVGVIPAIFIDADTGDPYIHLTGPMIVRAD